MSKQKLHHSDGKSNKFWLITLEGCTQTVSYGKIGTTGQTQTKEFATVAEAKRSYEKLIQEKLKKGYIAAEASVTDPTQSTNAEEPILQAETKTPATDDSVLATLRSESQPTITAVTITRSIELEPEDWLWATWRQHLPQQRPKRVPFNQQEALARLAKVPVRRYGWEWDWFEAQIVVSLSREEAHFWFTAMTEANRDIKPKLADKMAEKTFNGELSLEQVRNAIALSGSMTPPEIMLPLANLFCVADLADLMQINEKIPFDNQSVGFQSYGSPHQFLNWHVINVLTKGFRTYVLPYLTPVETEALHQRLRPDLQPVKWPTNPDESPPAAFHLAAYFGIHNELQALVESWPDDSYNAGSWSDYYHRPQEIIFGFGDPRQVELQMRRLKLRLKTPTHVRAWLAHSEYTALDFVRDSILSAGSKEDATALLEAFALVKAPEAAPYMLELMLSSKAPRPARQWLEENSAHAIAGLIALAGGRGTLSLAAIKFLRGMKRKGHEAFIRTCLEQETKEIADKVRTTVLEFEEKDYIAFDSNTTPEWLRTAVTDALGQKKIKHPTWIDSTDLPAVVVGEYCLNNDQVAALLLALQQSKLHPHLLVSELRDKGDRASLDAFAWQLFELWLHEGASSKEKWEMIAVGLLGTDTSALRLAPMIRVWPGESQHQRAVLGLQCLRAIGTDTALMQINGIAQKLKFKGLKEQAQQCMEDIAKDRGLTRTQLEDRIIPDCDLDERGSRVFDFGSRQFRFVLGAQMKPMVRDDLGKLKTDLPKPGVKDDAELALQAIADWKLLKKQVSEVAKIQAVRLEQAMVTGRRWRYEEFETLLVRHPLMTNLVRLVVWAGYNSEGQLTTTFRVTEDQTYADAEDETCDLSDVTEVGIVHPLHLSVTLRSAWGELFSDYEIVPPFPQLGRTIYVLEQGEAESIDLTRFQHISIPAVSLVGTLDKLGWLRGVPQDAGIFFEHCKPFYGANVTAVVEYDGVPVGYMVDWDDQKINRCFFVPGIYTPEGYPQHKNALKLEDIDPVAISEVLSDLSAVAAKILTGISR